MSLKLSDIKKLYDNKKNDEFRGFGFELPGFISSLFENQINIIKTNLIKLISKDYNLNEEELINKYIHNVEYINKNLERIEITKKRNYCKNIQNNNYCMARVFNKGNGGRCKRSCTNKVKYKRDKNGIDNSRTIHLCHIHYNVLKKNKILEYGLYDEPKPSIFTTKNPKAECIY